MQFKNRLRIFVISLLFSSFLSHSFGQTSFSIKSQWLDPTNLFTEKTPTAEFSSSFSVGSSWGLSFYYAHDIANLTPIYLITGVNNTRSSIKADSLYFASGVRSFAKYSRNIFISYQYSETIHHLSWLQPVITWSWNFTGKASKSVHTLTADLSGWVSNRRENTYQDGAYLIGTYSYAKYLEKWILNTGLSTLFIEIFEPDRTVFVWGEVLSLSSTYVPFGITLEIVLNKPLITVGDSDLGFTIGLIKEF